LVRRSGSGRWIENGLRLERAVRWWCAACGGVEVAGGRSSPGFPVESSVASYDLMYRYSTVPGNRRFKVGIVQWFHLSLKPIGIQICLPGLSLNLAETAFLVRLEE
jgi:hypothetical protein